MTQNTKGVIGLAARARKIVIGTNNVITAIRSRKTRLVLIATDVSDNTRKTLTDKAAYYSVKAESADATVKELGKAVGHDRAAAVAFLDGNFIKAYRKSLSDSNTLDEERGM